MNFFSEDEARSYLENSGYLIDGMFWISPPHRDYIPTESEIEAIELLQREYDYDYEDMIMD